MAVLGTQDLPPLQIEGARALADANAISHVRVVAHPDGLSVEINRSFVIANRARQRRHFAKADTCFSWLREMGVKRINEVDLVYWGAAPASGMPRILAAWEFSISALGGVEWQRLSHKAESLSKKGRHAEAVLVTRQALQLAEDALDPDHPDLALLMANLAIEHHLLGELAEAEPLYKRALQMAETAFGKEAPIVARCLNNLAEVYDAQGNLMDTDDMYLRALAITEKADGKDSVSSAMILTNLAFRRARRGAYESAEQQYERALKIWGGQAGLLGKMPPNAALTLLGLTALYRKTGREKEIPALEKREARIKALG